MTVPPRTSSSAVFPVLTSSGSSFKVISAPLDENDRQLNDVLQFPDVARIRVTLQNRAGPVGYGGDVTSVSFCVEAEKMQGEGQDVFFPLPQGRQVNGRNLQPVKQVFPEKTSPGALFKISVRGGDHPHIQPHGPVAPQPFDLPFLEHPQGSALNRPGHISDFIQENGPAVGVLELADPQGRGARKRPPSRGRRARFRRDSRAAPRS